jgi:hypothetical protein
MDKFKVIKELDDGTDYVIGYIRPNFAGAYYFYPQQAGRRVSRKGRVNPMKAIPVWAQKMADRVERV